MDGSVTSLLGIYISNKHSIYPLVGSDHAKHPYDFILTPVSPVVQMANQLTAA